MARGKIFFVIITSLLILFFISQIFDVNTRLISSNFKPNPLTKIVMNSLKDSQGTYAVVIKNFKNGQEFALNENRVYEPGSLYKLWLMATVYTHIKDGRLKEDDILSQNIPTLNQKFAIIDPELTEGGITATVSQSLHQMITISHNYAALLLAEKVGNSQIKVFLNQNGLNASDIGDPPQTTASDIALFYEKLYRKELVTPEFSDKMIEILKKQQLNDGLPRYLPPETIVAHKTGDLGWFKHDAGVVFTQKGDYLIIILSESDSPTGAQNRIALLSKAVYDYFNKD
ncbi:hypothetical protein A3H85_02660 [Candidatus Daviesbacteria bacterium RIFCSPLOWO2_02_FULL_40_8]|uniref:Beta-lactamase class A catalytic domain-containing protein n=1 Tax=Candidatus Daviesbacteria bacterium RIFCSPLOWO2_01_FULL_40_24 TaxID=1797787 RepID=A0A1F5MII4_9BACT|nr:MAG: hypothetical protein A2780_03390 [Candidatus Daviesbacteria bacterium RIFCSPHIGHO2_01_FULL_41_45]OGE34189.1 MAG: hypothetical protein A3C32_00475 [Candidatus Daviesbacteria bacterium RIFCSPHIGHO2_02_FULL_41_14]OGE65173.1 MAG: hypothetical protein A3B49_01425 [Candidatus Daviesbacteria bacterium RIFCSPLOWO2_01_FULL_40_24]OGE66876.1 MAG: hypothetical protein A3H85_02660 [Candidatus Daviesbacteria bacterium RIFCSPLOWO2_02_FULL_40_8]